MFRRLVFLSTASSISTLRSTFRNHNRFPSVIHNQFLPTLCLLVTTAVTITNRNSPTILLSSAFSTIPVKASDPKMPQPPFPYRRPGAPILDLTDLGVKLLAADQKRQEAYHVSRTIQIALVRARNDMEASTDSNLTNQQAALAKIQVMLLEALETSTKNGGSNDGKSSRSPRDANLGHRVEDFVRLVAFQHFLQTGGLLPPSECAIYSTDEEYLSGACMGLCQDLSRYAMGRATARDVSSVQQARSVVSEILDYLMEFDFRNGYLRRTYDGTKYCLKTLETVLYELSVTGAAVLDDNGVDNNDSPTESPPKTSRLEGDAEITKEKTTKITGAIQAELDAIRLRMERRDELREQLIKKCRDGQKAAKQAIYALHRGDYKKSSMLLHQCKDCITNELLPIVDEDPPLRAGSFSNVLEEYVEAKMFATWLGVGDADIDGKSPPSKGTLLLPHDFGSIPIEADEYLGGLCDLTGEIGRFAVQRGTNRDYEDVRACLEANSAVSIAIQTLERYPGTINKKMEQLKRSVEKIERMTYEMSLSKAAGLNMHTELTEAVDAAGGEDDV